MYLRKHEQISGENTQSSASGQVQPNAIQSLKKPIFTNYWEKVKVHRSGSSTTAKKGQARGVMKLRVCNDYIYHPKWPF